MDDGNCSRSRCNGESGGHLVEPFLQLREFGIFFWNVFASGITETGRYELRLTPVAPNNTDQAVGPSKNSDSLELDLNLLEINRVDVIILPPERIITPGLAGYNDTLDVLFRAPEVSRSRFAIFDLGGYRVYETENSHQELGNGWRKYTWNGKADNRSGGRVVEDGLYIYLLLADGKLVKKGTFALAR
jgi:hypothetical protein